jgi:hypothetical protein
MQDAGSYRIWEALWIRCPTLSCRISGKLGCGRAGSAMLRPRIWMHLPDLKSTVLLTQATPSFLPIVLKSRQVLFQVSERRAKRVQTPCVINLMPGIIASQGYCTLEFLHLKLCKFMRFGDKFRSNGVANQKTAPKRTGLAMNSACWHKGLSCKVKVRGLPAGHGIAGCFCCCPLQPPPKPLFLRRITGQHWAIWALYLAHHTNKARPMARHLAPALATQLWKYAA